MVLLSGEPGIGKSRITQTVCERVADEPHTRLRYQCLPYYANSAFYPIVAQLERAARFARDDTPDQKLAKLEALLAQSTESIAEVAPLLAALLSIPTGDRYPPLHLSPQRQKAKTIEVLVDQMVRLSHRQPVVCIFEDAHWGDPTSREVLDLIVNRVPDERVLMIITYRPEFEARWTAAAHVTALTLTRLRREQVVTMVEQLTRGKALPHEVLDQIIAKTDGIPLFVEELTKTILESGLLREVDDHYTLIGPLPPLAIPATLQDSLMARLDRLAPVKEVAQLGAAIGREFSYELLAAVTPLRHMELEDALNQLIEAELLFRRGQPPEAHYRFKHALVQDTAYASLLRSTRQSLHARIATVLEERFPATAATEPEVLAHHYTEAGFREQAVNYWKLAGQRAVERSANSEAVQHLTKGLELLVTLPETPTRTLQELDLQLVLGPALMATRGIATPEVEQIYARARVLCAQAGETPQVFLTLRGLWQFYYTRGALLTARELGEQILSLAQREALPTPRLEAYDALGGTLFYLGEYADAQMYLEQGIALTDPVAQRALTLRHGVVPGVSCLTVAALTLWCLGYPARAMQRGQEALALAQELEHPYSLAVAQHFIAFLHYRRRDASAVQEQADALLTLAAAQGFPLYVGHGTCWRGWVLAMQGQNEGGMVQLGQGLAAVVATGQLLSRPFHLLLLVEAAGHAGQVEEGQRLLAEALTAFEASGRGDMLAEAYRLQGELLLRQAIPDATQAEACFQQALALARCQQAKSWELRAAMSLSRLWKQQGKRVEAQALLAPIYHWFTEGFDTADLQEAKALLKNLGIIVDT